MSKAAFFAAAAAAGAGAALCFMGKRTSPSPNSPSFYNIHLRLARAARAGLSLLLPSPLVHPAALNPKDDAKGFEGIEAELKPEEASVSQESFDAAGESKAEEELEVVEDGEEGAEGAEPVKASGQEECLGGSRDLEAEEKAEEEEEDLETQEGFKGTAVEDLEVSQESFDAAGESKAEEEEELEVVEDGEEGAEGAEPVKASGQEECLDGSRDLEAEEKAEEEEEEEEEEEDLETQEGFKGTAVEDLEVSQESFDAAGESKAEEEEELEVVEDGEEGAEGGEPVKESGQEERLDGSKDLEAEEKAEEEEEEAQEDVSDEGEDVVEGGDLVEVSVQDLLTVEVEGGAEDHKMELLAVQEGEGDVMVLIQEEGDKGDVTVLIREEDEDEGDCKVFVQEELKLDVDDQSSSEIIISVEAEGRAHELVDGGDDVQPVISSVSAVASEPSGLHVPFMMFGAISTAIHPTGLLPSIVVGTIPTPLRPLRTKRTMPYTIQKDSIVQPSSSICFWNKIIAASSHSLTPSSLDKLEHKAGYDSYPATYSGREMCGSQHSRAASSYETDVGCGS